MHGQEQDSLDIYIQQISKIPLITVEEEVLLAKKISEGDDLAREKMITANLRLVVKIAQDYSNIGMSLLDLINEGNIGLMKAVERFDPTKGGKLSTYAAWWIRQRIQRLIGKMSGAVAVPHDVSQGKRKESLVRTQLQVELGRMPTEEEVKRALGSDRNLSNRVKHAPTSSLSIDEPLAEDSNQTLGDILAEEVEHNQSYREDGSLSDDVNVALSFLDQREKKVLAMRFGIGRSDSMKLDDIAEELNVSGERVRQLESLGLRKLRAVLLKNGKIDFGKLDKLVGSELRGKTKMSPLELSLVLDSAA